ncbi:uncharacterized protein K02A2.6-like [Copidosoma floridanum]|uniref:uncharacterized protein K02A2.6-like n=1 Tax=Copidosoma floridanum TaxID=29053 RepID=UPI0006C9B686|nr:uncharacterized protein K02A2.6-like [Copidosoma floridanum]
MCEEPHTKTLKELIEVALNKEEAMVASTAFASSEVHKMEGRYSNSRKTNNASGSLKEQNWDKKTTYKKEEKSTDNKGSQNGAADGLSRLPPPETGKVESDFDYLNYFALNDLPIQMEDIRKKTKKYPILGKVYSYSESNWPSKTDLNHELEPFVNRRTEISIDLGVILWGYRIVIPSKLRRKLLNELHSTHLGASKMKSTARQYFWWPKLDSQIVDCVKNCDACKVNAPNPARATLIKFEEALEPGDRVHIDFLGPFCRKMFMVIKDAYTKCPEVYHMASVTAQATVNKLRDFVARFGLPKKIVTDNGVQFSAEEFKLFWKKMGLSM